MPTINTDTPVVYAPSACPDGWLPKNLSHIPPCTWAGAIAGGVGAIIGLAAGYLPTGRLLNDPVMLAMSVQSLLRGFRYFNWLGLAIPLAYSSGLGVAAWYGLRRLGRRHGVRVWPDDVAHAATAAAVVSALPVWAVEVRGFQIILFYGLATLISAFVARTIARWLQRRLPD